MSQKASNINLIEVRVVQVIKSSKSYLKAYPFITTEKCNEGTFTQRIASPNHGRSLIADYNEDTKRYVITKGNGLTYFPYGFISTQEFENGAWGYLRREDALRDFMCGEFVSDLNILTNQMEAVYTLEEHGIRFSNHVEKIEPTILQYNVLCPYRIADIPFLSKELVFTFINSWGDLFQNIHQEKHCTAAEVLIKNINVMHKNYVLHNAIHSQNYTLSLELLDFELSRTPLTPYDSENDELCYKKLQKRELIQSLEIIAQIAYYFKENVNNNVLRQIMIRNGYEGYLQL